MNTIAQTQSLSISPKSLSISPESLSISQRLIAGSLALFIGLTLIAGVGFANDMAVHNGAHDTRHATGFPCH